MTHLSGEVLKDLWDANTPGSFPLLLTVTNPDIFWTKEESEVFQQEDGSINFISDNIKVKYGKRADGKDKVWLPCAFSFTPPEQSGSKLSTASISISALDARVKTLLGSIVLPSEVQIKALYCKQTKKAESGREKTIYKFIELNSVKLTLTSATTSKTVVTFSLAPDSSLQQSIPYDIALPNRVPAATN